MNITTIRNKLIDFAAAAAPSLAFVFLLSVASQCIPIHILAPSWQLGFCNIVLSQTPLALGAFFMMHFVVLLDPNDGIYDVVLSSWRRWAFFAVTGYILILPLCVFATIQTLTHLNAVDALRAREDEQRMLVLKSAIVSSGSTVDIQSRLRNLKGPILTSPDLKLPPEKLRARLQESLKEAHSAVRATKLQRSNQSRTLLIAGGVKICVTTLVYSFVFSSTANRRGDDLTLLGKLLSH